jgi:hypothetical protein
VNSVGISWPPEVAGIVPAYRQWHCVEQVFFEFQCFCGFSSGPKARPISAWGIAPGKRFIEFS